MVKVLPESSGWLSTSYYSSYVRGGSGAIYFLACLPAHPENSVENAWRKKAESNKAGINSGSCEGNVSAQGTVQCRSG